MASQVCSRRVLLSKGMNWQKRVREFERGFDYSRSDDWCKTEQLKGDIAAYRRRPRTRGLSLYLFDQIVDWKLRRQRHRTEAHRESLTPELVRRVVDCALTIDHAKTNELISVQVGVLSSLPGVGIGLATAVLALTFPNSYGVIDFRVWKIVFASEKRAFTVQDYIRYLDKLRPFAQESGWPVQKADFLVWSYSDIAYRADC